MEVKNVRLAILAQRDSKVLVPVTVEISYTAIDSKAEMASDKVIKKEVTEIDLVLRQRLPKRESA